METPGNEANVTKPKKKKAKPVNSKDDSKPKKKKGLLWIGTFLILSESIGLSSRIPFFGFS